MERIQRKNGDFESIKKFCDTKYPGIYELTECNGKLVAFSPNEGFHRIDWMREIYTRNITKKLRKLNDGNYSGINGKISLCMSIIHRAKSLYDAWLILSIYSEHSRIFNIKYNNLIIVTSKQLYLTTSEKVKNIPPIESQEQMCDFVNNHLTIIDYNYSQCHELTSTHFPNI